MKEEEFEYKLVGVVIHMGIADAGHYLSYINIERQTEAEVNLRDWANTDQQTWLEFNDSNVTAFNFSNLAYKAFGEEVQQ
jgi:ubiquitin C-terminal hydrolase